MRRAQGERACRSRKLDLVINQKFYFETDPRNRGLGQPGPGLADVWKQVEEGGQIQAFVGFLEGAGPQAVGGGLAWPGERL